jgi:uncharacterized membrane protein
MSPSLLSLVTLLAALGSGLVGGVIFASSTFVMPALSRLPPEQGIAAMQSINVAAINRWFMGALFGTAAACVLLIALSLRESSDATTGLCIGAGVLYLAGTILVTIVFNVPRNDALASLAPTSAAAVNLWSRYVREWSTWNHVRTASGLLASAGLSLVLLASRAGP